MTNVDRNLSDALGIQNNMLVPPPVDIEDMLEMSQDDGLHGELIEAESKEITVVEDDARPETHGAEHPVEAPQHFPGHHVIDQAVEKSPALRQLIRNYDGNSVTLNTSKEPPKDTLPPQPDLEKTDQGISKTTQQAASSAAQAGLTN